MTNARLLARGFSTAISAFLLFAATPALGQAIPQKNVNAIGPTPINWLYTGNPRMQQNEPECAVSPNNVNWLFCGFNDYRGVNDVAIGDAFPGVAMSRDGGLSWISGLAPGHLASPATINKKFGADANIEALPGLLLYNHIAGWRDDSQPGGVYVQRYYEHNREVGPPWEFLDIVEVDVGTSGKFLDKPAFDVSLRNPALGLPPITVDVPAFNDPRNINNVVDPFTLEVPAARAHLCYAVFVGNDNNNGTKITCVASDDGGKTWPIRNKLSESVEINQGVSVATRNFGEDVLAVWRRFDDNNETSAIIYAYSGNAGNSWTKPKVLTEFCAFDQGTGAARFRTNALPVVVSNGNEFAVYFASRNDATETCFIPGKGKNTTSTPRLSDVAFLDDFDSFGESRDATGKRIKDGQVRTFLHYSRIMMVRSTGSGNINWSTPVAIDPEEYPAGAANSDGSAIPSGTRKRGHQFMPAAESAGGIETVAWYDSRLDILNTRKGQPIPGGFIEDLVVHFEKSASFPSAPKWASASLLPAGLYDLVPPPPQLPPAVDNIPLRRTIDVFAAQILPGGSAREYRLDENYYPDANGSPGFPSTRVSRFVTRPVETTDGNGITSIKNEQVEFNYPNGRLFRKGKAPFLGDYNSVYSPQYRKQIDGTWVPNQSPPNPSTDLFLSPEPVFHIGWTSNRNVRGRVYYTGCDVWDEALQMWVAGSEGCESNYTDPQPGMMMPLQGEDGSQDGPPMTCTMAQVNGLKAGPLTRNQNIYTAVMLPGLNARVASAIKRATGDINTFVLAFDNGSDRRQRLVLKLPAGSNTSFVRDVNPVLNPDLEIELDLPRGSSNSRTVFDFSNEIDTNFAERVVLTAYACEQDGNGPVLDIEGSCASLGPVVANISLERSSLAPLETVLNNPRPGDDPVDVTQSEIYDLILKRENTQVLSKQLDLENLDLENLDLENTVEMLDLENLDLENLDLENLDLENLDLENVVLFLDLENLDLENLDLENALYENLDLENLDLENLDLENRSLFFLDLENLDLENTYLEFLDLENLDLENLDLENLDLENLDLENLDLENLDLENLDLENSGFRNSTFYAADLENLDLENLDLENTAVSDYTEVTWTADSSTNTSVGVDVNPIFSPQLAAAIASDPDAKVILTVRQPYFTSTVVTNSGGTNVNFCSPQVVVDNQLLYAAVLDPSQINDLSGDPNANVSGTPAFVANPDQTTIITLRFINPPDGFDPEMIDANSGMAIYSQPGSNNSCDPELEDDNIDLLDCEIDYIEPDSEPPIVTLNGPASVMLEAGPAGYTDAGATALDNRDGVLSPSQTLNTVNAAVPGLYQVTWSATDAAMNTGSATRDVEVVDTIAPVITLLGNSPVDIEAGDVYSDAGATASDFVSGNLSGNIVTNSTVDTTAVGTYSVSYNVSDAANNIATTVTRTVNVIDTTPPVITLIGDATVTVEAGSVFVDPGATASDIAEGDLSLSIVSLGTVNTAIPDTYNITYNLTDTSGNAAIEIVRTVIVEDTTAPVITLIGANPLTLEAGGTLFDPGVTATDGVDGSLDGQVIPTSNVNPLVAGSYSIAYNVTDSAGNIATTVTRQVIVVDTTDPVFTNPNPPIFVPEGPYILDPGATKLSIDWPITVQDLENGLNVFCTIDGIALNPVTTSYADGIFTAEFSFGFGAGTSNATCTAVDQNGNTTTSPAFSILVEDVPVINALNPTLTIQTDLDNLSVATVTNSILAANVSVSDQIDEPAVLTTDCSPIGALPPGQYDASCTVEDSAGNTATADFTLNIVFPYVVVFESVKGNVKAGSSVPIDFSYVDNTTGATVNSETLMPSAVWKGPFADRQCSTPSPEPQIEESDDAGSSDFRYANARDQWQYSWSTPDGSGYYLFTVSPPGTEADASICVRLR